MPLPTSCTPHPPHPHPACQNTPFLPHYQPLVPPAPTPNPRHFWPQDATGGIVGITARTGAVLQISVNEATLVPYVVNTLRDSALAIQLAARLNLPGADDLYMSEFNRMLGSNDVAAAARLAGESPNGERRRRRIRVCMCCFNGGRCACCHGKNGELDD